MTKKDCVFCNFKDKDVMVFEDSLCYAIISKDPINKHHVLVIPREHYRCLYELPDKLASHMFLVVKRLARSVRMACSPDTITYLFDDDLSDSGYNLVAHFKFHIIPRFKKDLHMIDWGKLRTDESSDARSGYAKEIRKHLD